MMRSLLLLCTTLVLVACGASFTSEDYAKIKNGMSLTEVKEILGEPTESAAGGFGSASGGAYIWKDGDKSITLTFAGDRLLLKVKQGF